MAERKSLADLGQAMGVASATGGASAAAAAPAKPKLDAQGRAIPGLYAAGNDMNSVMGGHYPSGGITLGPAMTFGFMAAHHAAGQPLPADAGGRQALAAH